VEKEIAEDCAKRNKKEIVDDRTSDFSGQTTVLYFDSL